MAIPWLKVLQSVPWSEVLRNAPKVVDGAMQLWSGVAEKPSSAKVSASNPQPTDSPGPHSPAALQTRIIAVEADVTNLHGQMLEATELIKALAAQNAQLVQRIETNRMHLRWLSAATVVVGLAALLGLLLAF
jgi:hypothetical protein